MNCVFQKGSILILGHYFIFALLLSLSSVQLLSGVDSVTPWTAAHQASLSITNYQSLLKFMSIELVMPSSHLILCHPLLLLPSFIPSIRVFSDESVLCIRWPKYWSFSFSISLSNDYSGLISFRIDWFNKTMTNLDSILKSRDITLPMKVCVVKAIVFPVVMCRCEIQTIKKAECQRIDAFELWCWRRLLRIPWTARRSNQFIVTLSIHWKEGC